MRRADVDLDAGQRATAAVQATAIDGLHMCLVAEAANTDPQFGSSTGPRALFAVAQDTA